MTKEENEQSEIPHLLESANIKQHLSIPGLNERVDFAIRVFGNGMLPKYSNEDILLCKKATNMSIIQWGKTYVVYTKDQELLTRRLMPSDKEGYINLATYSEDRPPYEISKDEIVDYYLVIASVRIE